MSKRWKLLTGAAILGIVVCLIFLAIRPINVSPDDLMLDVSEMPSGWKVVESMDDVEPLAEGGIYYSKTCVNDSIEVGGRLMMIIYCYDTVTERMATFLSVGPYAYNASDPMFNLGDKSKVFYGTSQVQDSNGTHFQDTMTTYFVVVGNVMVEFRFITAGPFAEEQEIRTDWMDDLVVAQCDKVREVGLLF